MLKGNESDEDYQTALAKAKTIAGGAEIVGDDKKDEIWVYDNRLKGSATIQAKKVLEGGTFKKGQFSFTLKDGDGRVLQTVTNDARAMSPSTSTTTRPIPTLTPSLRSSPRVPRTMSRTISPTTQPCTMLRLT